MAELLNELNTPAPRLYGARLPLGELLPELMPDLQEGPMARFGRFFGASSPINPICYIGAARQATPMHFDPFENLLCIVEGSKHLTLFHPADAPFLYPAGERNSAAVYSLAVVPPPHTHYCAASTVMAPADTSDISGDGVLDERFPLLQYARPLTVTVHAGDVLYLPCGWWHAVSGSNERNISVSYWFELSGTKGDNTLLQREGHVRALLEQAARQACARRQIKAQG